MCCVQLLESPENYIMQRIHVSTDISTPPPAGVWGYDQQTVQVLKKMQQETLPPDDITVDQNEVCVCVCVCARARTRASHMPGHLHICVCLCVPACLCVCVWQCEVYIAGPLWVTTNKPIK